LCRSLWRLGASVCQACSCHVLGLWGPTLRVGPVFVDVLGLWGPTLRVRFVLVCVLGLWGPTLWVRHVLFCVFGLWGPTLWVYCARRWAQSALGQTVRTCFCACLWGPTLWVNSRCRRKGMSTASVEGKEMSTARSEETGCHSQRRRKSGVKSQGLQGLFGFPKSGQTT